MKNARRKITVFYDGACPRCIKDRDNYLKLTDANLVHWYDITNRENELKQLGIDPKKALTELHITTADGTVLSELAAYIELMNQVALLKPIAWFIALPVIRPLLARCYHFLVKRRLTRQGRYPLNK